MPFPFYSRLVQSQLILISNGVYILVEVSFHIDSINPQVSTIACPPLEKASSTENPGLEDKGRPLLKRQMSLPTKPVQVQPTESALVPIKEGVKHGDASRGSSTQDSPESDDYSNSLQPPGKSRIRGRWHCYTLLLFGFKKLT